MKRSVWAWIAVFACVTASNEIVADDWTTLYGAAKSQARQISSRSLAIPLTPNEWESTVDNRRELWRDMLGLSPLPQRTPLNAKVTGILERGDYVVEKVYFESVPGAYVIGNLYRPAVVKERLPAVLFLCGHSQGKSNPTYQQHPRWFAQHGYVSLVLDPIQLGESRGIHHGTYNKGRWDWHSRGYAPIGTEVWNGIRALDYLTSRQDVDADRMGVTGLSGGGVVSWCLGAADERLKVVVPVCQSGSIEQVVADRSTDSHCDCAFWINYEQWCWPDVGALIAPRAFLIASGSEDVLWRPAGYRDVAHRLRKQYTALGKADQFDLVEDLSPHGYTPKLRKAIFTWFNTHLKNDPTPVTDDVTDFVEPVENLLVFEGKLPAEDRMSQIDTLLAPRPELPTITTEADWLKHRDQAIEQLRKRTFRYTRPANAPALREYRDDGAERRAAYGTWVFNSNDGVTLSVRTRHVVDDDTRPLPVLALAAQLETSSVFRGGGQSRPNVQSPVETAVVEVRNTGATSVGPGYLWTVQRTYPLFGETLSERQVSDLLAGISLIRAEQNVGPVAVYGSKATAPLAIYAALLDDQISEIVLVDPPVTHENPDTAQFLGILRVGDLPQNLALAYPRPITFIGKLPQEYEWTRQVYEKLGAGDRFKVIPNIQQWTPSN